MSARLSTWNIVIVCCVSLANLGCRDTKRLHLINMEYDEEQLPAPTYDPCLQPNEGCECENEGETAECGSVKEQRGEYLICSKGLRLCDKGEWSACQALSEERVVDSIRAPMQGGFSLSALSAASNCNNLCDPQCKRLGDTPEGLIVNDDLFISSDGLTLPGSGSGGSCDALVTTPGTATITITDIASSGAVTASPPFVGFAGTCAGGPIVQPNWTLDAYDRAVIDQAGTLRVFSGVAGPVRVTGSTALDSASSNVTVKVNIGALVAEGSTNDPGKTLYPYRNTVFPLDLPAPLVQWNNGGITPNQVQVALRFPRGSTNPTFLYAKTYTSEPKQGLLNTSVPAWQIPQHIWSAFDRSAAGDATGGEIIIRRKTSSTTYKQLSIPVRFASESVRGTVYYTQYQRTLSSSTCSTQSCSYSGTSYTPGQTCPVGTVTHGSGTLTSQIRAIDLSSPIASNTNPLGNVGGCPVCHSVSADGNTVVSGNQAWQDPIVGGIADIDLAGSVATFKPKRAAPTYTGLSDDGAVDAAGDPYNNYERTGENSRGFSYAAISPDGTTVLQGPTFWGNTADTPASNNTQDATLRGLAGKVKPYFFADTRNPGVGVQFATTSALPSYSWSSSSGTFSGSSGSLTVDGVTLTTVGQSVLVKNESSASRNGVYVLTQVTPWRLQRRYDVNSSSELRPGLQVRVSDGQANTGRVFFVSSPSAGTISVNSTSVVFGEQTRPAPVYGTNVLNVSYATTGALGPGTVAFSSNVLTAGSNGALVVDGVTLGLGASVLVKDQATASTNGVYTVTTAGTAAVKWKLTRRSDANGNGELYPGLEVRVSSGATNAGRVLHISSPSSGTITLNTTAIGFSDNTMPSMMVPQFSPDGRKLVYVNADADIAGGASASGWRRGLTLLDLDPATLGVSNKRRLVNTYSSSTTGVPIKWPFFENDSRSIVYVETETNEYCSAADSDHSITVNNDQRRACFQAAYGSMSPTTRGYWKGKLFSVNSDSPTSTRVELSKLNDADDDGGSDDAIDGDRSYQPTVLPFAAGGYRWVIFTSPRAYGNQFNARSNSGTPTHFSCSAAMLWMSALVDQPAGSTDRSQPAFLLPAQNMANITSANHYINERGYLVGSQCKDEGAACTSDDECCGSGDSPPSVACRAPVGWTPASGPPHKTCEALAGTCSVAGESCSTASDCCNGNACVDFSCVTPSDFEPASFVREYVAECPVGYHPTWQLFSFHLTTDLDSRLHLEARSSSSLDSLETAPLVTVGTSSATARSPAPPEFIDTGAALELAGVSRHQTYLRLIITLEPSSDGSAAPILHDWEQRYTCEAAE